MHSFEPCFFHSALLPGLLYVVCGCGGMLLYSIPLGKYVTGEPFPGGGHLGCFQILFSFTNSVAWEILECTFRNGSVGYLGMQRFSCYASLYSPRQFIRNPINPHSFPLSEMFIFTGSHSLFILSSHPCFIWRVQCSSIDMPNRTSRQILKVVMRSRFF